MKKKMITSLPVFVETKDGTIWFIFLKYNNDYLAIPKYRIVNNILVKGKSYQSWFSPNFLQLNDYKRYINFIGESSYSLNEKEIIRVINPKDYNKVINDVFVFDLISNLARNLKIAKSKFGIEGSYILRKNNTESDVDIFVYGLDNSHKVKKYFNTMLSHHNFRKVPLNIIKTKLNKLKDSGFGTNDTEAILQFQKRYYGYYKNKPFSIVCVPESFEYINILDNLEHNNAFEGEVVVIDDTYASLIPSKYTVKYKDELHTLYIYDHYGINQAKKGDHIYLKCKKYKSQLENDVFIIAFWNNYDSIFNNLSLIEVKND